MNENHETSAALRLAYGAVLRSSAELLDAWRDQLPPEKREKLASFGAKGLALGLAINIPQTRWLVTVTLVDAKGALTSLDTIELVGGSLALN